MSKQVLPKVIENNLPDLLKYTTSLNDFLYIQKEARLEHHIANFRNKKFLYLIIYLLTLRMHRKIFHYA